MQIGNSALDKVCVEAIVPALESCGLNAKRVDKHNEGGLLKSEIIKFIQEADIIIADLTNERPNCYLEVGYTMGIDKFRNLILTVREDHFPESKNYKQGGPKVHFDLGGYDILVWSPDRLDIFCDELKKRIQRRLAIITPKTEKVLSPWNEEWITEQRTPAYDGLKKSGFSAGMEIRFSLSPPKPELNHQQLNEAARNSTISTFGWPIGVYLGNRPEYCPRPRADGLIAIVPIEDNTSYDYWALKRNGDFYSLSSLFEDRRKPDYIFADTRVLRAAEGLLYCERLYSNLGIDPSTRVHFALRFTGLKNRVLGVASSRRFAPEEHRCIEDLTEPEITGSLQEIEVNMTKYVKQLLSPLFVLFEFYQISDSVYDDIVDKFLRGQIGA